MCVWLRRRWWVGRRRPCTATRRAGQWPSLACPPASPPPARRSRWTSSADGTPPPSSDGRRSPSRESARDRPASALARTSWKQRSRRRHQATKPRTTFSRIDVRTPACSYGPVHCLSVTVRLNRSMSVLYYNRRGVQAHLVCIIG